MPEPLRVTAHVQGEIALSTGVLALDATLAAAVALRDDLPPLSLALEPKPLEIPIQREPGGRFHLASFAVPRFDQHGLRYTNKRFPVPEAQAFGAPSLRRINLTSGATKSYRLPMSAGHVEGDSLIWYCLGERAGIDALLGLVHYLGRRRAVGLGRVLRWEVEPCEPWEGFPVVRDGKPLRPLPLDWPGLADAQLGWATLTYPYWERAREVECAVPEAAERRAS